MNSDRKLLSITVLLSIALLAGAAPARAQSSSNPCQNPANRIVAENCLQGSDSWKIHQYSANIAGFPSATSINAGEEIRFYVTTNSPSFSISLFRSGYYDGLGGRLLMVVDNIRGILQPPCNSQPDTGLVSCSNWDSSFTLRVPSSWVTGIYIAKFIQSGPEWGENYTVFVVRNDDDPALILYQQNVTTYQAYNNYGGKSLYSMNSGVCTTNTGAPRASKVSLDRPYSAPMNDPASYFRAEYPMVYWLEQQGYDVAYSTSLDTHLSGVQGASNRLLQHKIFISAGHDEYWSQEMRNAMTMARDYGVNLGFFTGNTGYWKVRFEPDPWTGAPNRVMVGYKTVESGSPDPSGISTTTWRDPNGPNDPENGLIGIAYVGDNDLLVFPLRVSAEQAADRIYRNTGLQNMPSGSYVDIGHELVGWEWDAVINNGHTPPGLTVLAASPTSGGILIDAGRIRQPGAAVANVSRYIASSGAMVFSAGTIQWSHGLAIYERDPRIEQITYNVLADMGVQPATPDDQIIPDQSIVESNAPKKALPTYMFPDTGSQAPALSKISVNVKATSAEISWKSDHPGTGALWLVTPDGVVSPGLGTGESYVAEGDYLSSHTLSMDSLLPGQTYFYRIVSTDAAGKTTVSEVMSFQTPGSTGSQIKDSLTQFLQPGICSLKPAGQEVKYWLNNKSGLALLTGGGMILVVGIIIIGVVLMRPRGKIKAA